MGKDWLDFVTLATAVLGAVLGIVSTWRSFALDRVKLRVGASLGIGVPVSEPLIVIEVVNLSSFPVTVTTIGFYLDGTDRHLQITHPVFTRGEQLPVRLEPRAAFTVAQPARALQSEHLVALRSVYIKTACGLEAQSKRGALRNVNTMALAGEP